jgi:biopolymer transport protein ExbD
MSALLYQPRRRALSLTALIDVVFILLMFFMLTSSFTRWKAVDLQSPVASSKPTADTPQLILLQANGALKLHGSELSLAHFSALQAQHLSYFNAPQATLVLPAADVDLQTMIAAIEQLQQLGLASVALGSAQPAADEQPAATLGSTP